MADEGDLAMRSVVKYNLFIGELDSLRQEAAGGQFPLVKKMHLCLIRRTK